MRARVEVVIRDEEGNILSQLALAWMDLGSQSLHDIARSLRDVETTGATGNRGRFVKWGTKPVHTRDKKNKNLIVTAHEWCGLRQYMESLCLLYKNTNLMHKKQTTWL